MFIFPVSYMFKINLKVIQILCCLYTVFTYLYAVDIRRHAANVSPITAMRYFRRRARSFVSVLFLD